jgi:hypothetical protein
MRSSRSPYDLDQFAAVSLRRETAWTKEPSVFADLVHLRRSPSATAR